jgi:hypothetical protein
VAGATRALGDALAARFAGAPGFHGGAVAYFAERSPDVEANHLGRPL